MAQSLNKYEFNEEQMREMLKVSYELDECEKTICKLNNLIDSSSYKIDHLNNLIIKKDKEVKKNIKIAKTWKNITFSLGLISLAYILFDNINDN